MSKRVLLVEDNKRTVEVLSQQLTLLGYDVLAASSGEEAVRKAIDERPDVIIMDIRMPKMDGFEAVARIRSDPSTRAVPIIAATGQAMSGDREKCLDAGCDEYLAKPFTHRELKTAIEKVLNSSPS
jgi:CheY-like chemotaxis protein